MSGINQDTVNRLNSMYFAIVGQNMTNDEMNEILSIAARLGMSDEFYISQMILGRANRINGEKNAAAIQQAIDNGIKGSNIEKSSNDIMQRINNIHEQTIEYMDKVDKRATQIIAARAAYIGSELSSKVKDLIIKDLREDIKAIIQEEFNQVTKMKKSALIIKWVSISAIISSVVTFGLNKPNIIIAFFKSLF